MTGADVEGSAPSPTTTGTTAGTAGTPGTGPSSPRTACLRHWLRVEAVTPWRVATALTDAPGTKLSAMIRAFSDTGQRRRLGSGSGSHGKASASSWSASATPVAARETSVIEIPPGKFSFVASTESENRRAGKPCRGMGSKLTLTILFGNCRCKIVSSSMCFFSGRSASIRPGIIRNLAAAQRGIGRSSISTFSFPHPSTDQNLYRNFGLRSLSTLLLTKICI